MDAVNGMAAFQPVMWAYGSQETVSPHNRLICRHNIDCVHTDEHRIKPYFVVLAKHRTAP